MYKGPEASCSGIPQMLHSDQCMNREWSIDSQIKNDQTIRPKARCARLGVCFHLKRWWNACLKTEVALGAKEGFEERVGPCWIHIWVPNYLKPGVRAGKEREATTMAARGWPIIQPGRKLMVHNPSTRGKGRKSRFGTSLG